MQEISVPPVGPRDVLVRIKTAGVCHSDVHYRAEVSPVDPLPLTLAHELPWLIELARRGVLDLTGVVTDTLSLDAAAVNQAMDRLERFGSDVRQVIVL